MRSSKSKRGEVLYSPRLPRRALEELESMLSPLDRSPHPAIEETLRTLEESYDLLSRHLVDLDCFRGVDSARRPKRYSGKTLVVDKHAIYVPYHYDHQNYGIYFRIKRVWEDFAGFAGWAYRALHIPRALRILAEESDAQIARLLRLRRDPHLLVRSLFVEYIVFHYAHMVSHHVFEDIGLIFERMGKGRYSLVKSLEEENFCSYVAFTTLERYIPGVLARSRKAERLVGVFHPLIHSLRLENIESMNFATTKLLYIYYDVARNPWMMPRVDSRTMNRIGLIFWALWKLHYTYEEDLVDFKNRPLIYRLYLTTY